MSAYGSPLTSVWISSDDVKAVAEKGFKLIHAASDYFYLVCLCSTDPYVYDPEMLTFYFQDCGGGGWVGDFPTGYATPTSLLHHHHQKNQPTDLSLFSKKLMV
jgi:hypothetical protein